MSVNSIPPIQPIPPIRPDLPRREPAVPSRPKKKPVPTPAPSPAPERPDPGPGTYPDRRKPKSVGDITQTYTSQYRSIMKTIDV